MSKSGKVSVGFTGTRKGMTDRQKMVFIMVIAQLEPDEFHHGDCVGADAEAHNIARKFGAKIFIHPPDNNSMRAFKEGGIFHEPKPYLDRNKDIVCSSDIMIATPDSSVEKVRSGTWSTIRYAVKLKRSVYVITPTGDLILKRAGGMKNV